MSLPDPLFNPEEFKVEHNFILKYEDIMKVANRLANYQLEAMKQADRAKSEDKLVSPAEACEKFGCSRSTLTRWDRSGYIKPVKIGGKCFYRESQIEELLNTKTE